MLVKVKQKNLCAISLIAFSMLVFASESEAPSVEFLEFLAEFSEVADEDFEILVFHALDDSMHAAATQAVEDEDED